MTEESARGAALELEREQAHVDLVHQRMAELRVEAEQVERESLSAEVADNPQSLYERDVTAFNASLRRSMLEVSDEGLVFGRIDRCDGEVLHVGKLGVRTVEQECLVVDWRAPAAAPFYQATAARPAGVVRRRRISCQHRKVLDVEDEILDVEAAEGLEGTVVGDGAFLAALSRTRTDRMRDIVATIQGEQDRVVRAPDDGMLLVTGGPGTGKTAVALHRIAYLMYSRRDVYSRRGVLVVGPSEVFLEYVSRVLPSLGEDSVMMTSLESMVSLPPGFSAGAPDRPEVAAVKGSERVAVAMGKVVGHLGRPPGQADLTVSWRGVELEVARQSLTRRRSALGRGGRLHNPGREAFRSALLDMLWESYVEVGPPELKDETTRSELLEALRYHPRVERTMDAYWPLLSVREVWEELASGRVPLQRIWRGVVSEDDVELLLSSWAGGEGDVVTPLDAALLDEIASLLGPVPLAADDDEEWDDEVEEVALGHERSLRRVEPVRSLAHVVVDEAQDVAPSQWRALARRGRGATWTVVGDWAQSSWSDVSEVRDAMARCRGRLPLRSAELTTNYRTSTEIASLAATVLDLAAPDELPPRAVRPTGIEPELLVGGAAEAAAAALEALAGTEGTVGIVAPEGLLEEVSPLLGSAPRVRVLTPWQAKGLEFDVCVVLHARGIVEAGTSLGAGLRSLYVCVTRATQRLVVVSDEPLEDLFEEWAALHQGQHLV